jgi:hypothetical protein
VRLVQSELFGALHQAAGPERTATVPGRLGRCDKPPDAIAVDRTEIGGTFQGLHSGGVAGAPKRTIRRALELAGHLVISTERGRCSVPGSSVRLLVVASQYVGERQVRRATRRRARFVVRGGTHKRVLEVDRPTVHLQELLQAT